MKRKTKRQMVMPNEWKSKHPTAMPNELESKRQMLMAFDTSVMVMVVC
jgi:hypothetical protein